MHDPNYQLTPQPARRTRRSSRWLVAMLVVVMIAAGAVAGPLLLPNGSALATEPATVQTVGQIDLTRVDPAQIENSSLFADQEALANLYDQVLPSVVSIEVQVPGQENPFFGTPDGDNLQEGSGSGWIYDADGHIVTNNHVVEDAERVVVLFYNGFWTEAEVVATDSQADLAVLKVTPPEGFEWRPLPLANSHELRVGHTVVAMGSPFGLESTMTRGIVSALGRGVPTAGRYELPEVIQTDAAINPGNSGGPLVNLRGELVGVDFAIRSQVRSNSGVGFAIPVSIVERVVPALIEDGDFEYSFLGVGFGEISIDTVEALGLPENQLGVYVDRVIAGSGAEAAGIRGGNREAEPISVGFSELYPGGDVILAVDGERTARFRDLTGYLVTETSPGDTVTLTVLRDGEQLEVPVTLTSRANTLMQTDFAPEPGVTGREAISIAREYAEETSLLDNEISGQPSVRSGESQGVEVWIVELTDGEQTATVTVDRVTGEVLDSFVE